VEEMFLKGATMNALRCRNVFAFLLLALSITTLASAHQREILVGCLGEFESGFWYAAPNVKLAQAFVLASRSYVTSIQVDSFQCVAEECGFYLTDAITLGEGVGRIFATMTLPSSDYGSHTFQVNRMLDAGSYCLVIATTKSVDGTGFGPTVSWGGRVQPRGNAVGLFHLTNSGSYKGRWEAMCCWENEISLLFRVYGLQPINLDIKTSGDCSAIVPTVGNVEVTILSPPQFDAATVNPTTVRFGATGTEATPLSKANIRDTDCDGKEDMVLRFSVNETGIKCGDTSATLTAKTITGQDVVGVGSIKTMRCQ
jgi:hypothetical protein